MSVSEGRPPRSPANFCAQAADLVRVRSLLCTRNGRSRHFRQKNTYVLAQFPSDPLPGLLWPRCLPDSSQMSPRCLSHASQMPPDASQMPPDASPKKLFGVSRWGNFCFALMIMVIVLLLLPLFEVSSRFATLADYGTVRRMLVQLPRQEL